MSGSQRHTALAIAQWFLAWAEDQDADISNLKMQKLLYYAQGHFLAAHGEPLFREPVEAWAHGPVVASVYHAFKAYGKGEIDADAMVPDSFDWDDYREVEADLLLVWRLYGGFEAWALRNKTHAEAPWLSAFEARPEGRNPVITHKSMREFFASKT